MMDSFLGMYGAVSLNGEGDQYVKVHQRLSTVDITPRYLHGALLAQELRAAVLHLAPSLVHETSAHDHLLL